MSSFQQTFVSNIRSKKFVLMTRFVHKENFIISFQFEGDSRFNELCFSENESGGLKKTENLLINDLDDFVISVDNQKISSTYYLIHAILRY